MPMTPLTGLDRTSPTFKTDLDTFFLTNLPQFVTEANALEAAVEAAVEADKTAAAGSAVAAAASAVAADASADAAAASAVAAGNSASLVEAALATSAAPPFVSGQTVAVGDVLYSPISFETYRAKTAGVRTTDPSVDDANWHGLGSAQAQSAALLWAFALN